jgi:dihydrofolate reductase
MAKNRVIGRDGALPWHLPEDLKRFRQLTMGHHIVMGRKTWESLGRLLPGRHHVIVSRSPGYAVPGATVAGSVDAAIAACGGDDEVFVIGGGEIYALALPVADRILLTEIEQDFDGDAYFPALRSGQWRESERVRGKDPSTGLAYSFVTLERSART